MPMDTLLFDDITIEIQRKWVRTLRLKICSPDGRVVITAPVFMTDKQILNFVNSKTDWIKKNQAKVITRSANKESKPYLYTKQELLAIISRIMTAKCAEYAEPNVSWKLRKMKTRWGSCLPAKRSITFNSELAKYPESCIEYVVIHELCHLQIPNHGADFKALMTKRMPEWKTIKKELNNC